jgi:hypothetical protein
MDAEMADTLSRVRQDVSGTTGRRRQLSGELNNLVRTQSFNDRFKEYIHHERWAAWCQ